MDRPKRPEQDERFLLQEYDSMPPCHSAAIDELIEYMDKMDRFADVLIDYQFNQTQTVSELGAARAEAEQARGQAKAAEAQVAKLTQELQLAQAKLLGVALLIR